MVPGWAGLGFGNSSNMASTGQILGRMRYRIFSVQQIDIWHIRVQFQHAPYKGHIDYFPLPHQQTMPMKGGYSQRHFFCFFCSSHFLASTQKSEGAGRTFLSAHRTHSNVSRQTTHTHSEDERFHMWTDFQISLVLSGSTSWQSFHTRDEEGGSLKTRGEAKQNTERDRDVVS